MKGTEYEIRMIQCMVPVMDGDSFEDPYVKKDTLVTTICTCRSEDWAKRLKEYISAEILAVAEYEENAWTPELVLVKKEANETVIPDEERSMIPAGEARDDEKEYSEEREADWREEELDKVRQMLKDVGPGVILQVNFMTTEE